MGNSVDSDLPILYCVCNLAPDISHENMKDSNQNMAHTLTYALVEDEYYTAQELKTTMAYLRSNYVLLDQAEDVEGMVELLQNNKVDLLITDVQLSDGLCFDALNKLDVSELPIIFTTAYVQYREKAQQYNMVDFLLKPYPSEKLERAIKRFEKQNIYLLTNHL